MSRTLGRMLVPVDGSPTADRAIGMALALAARHGSELIFCTAVNSAAAIAETAGPYGTFDPGPMIGALDDAADHILADVDRRAKGAGISATVVRLDGPAAPAIVTYAKENTVDAIVMGTQGKRGLERLFLGSTAEGVLRTTDIPVFVVHPSGDEAPASGAKELSKTAPVFDSILVAADDSDPSFAATSFALGLAANEGSRVLLCNVIETGDLLDKARDYGYDPTPMLDEFYATARTLLDHAAEPAKKLGVDTDNLIVEGTPVDGVLRTAADQKADLIAIGTHGRRGLRRLFIGSVAEGVVRRSPVPVVVVRVATTHATTNERSHAGAPAQAKY